MRTLLLSLLIFSTVFSSQVKASVSSHSNSHSHSHTPSLDKIIAQILAAELARKYHFPLQGPPGPTGPAGPQGLRGARGLQGPTGPQGIAAQIRPLTRTIFVDASTTSTTQDGSIANPYSSIQAAINTIPPTTLPLEQVLTYTILIASGIYDEDVVITLNNQQVELVALGQVVLVSPGTFSGRNFTVNFTATTDLGLNAGSGLSITNINATTFATQDYSQAGRQGKFVILGKLFINDTSSIPDPNIINNVIINASVIDIDNQSLISMAVDARGSTRIHNLFCDNAILLGVTGPQTIISAKFSSLQSINVRTYDLIISCILDRFMTITAAPASPQTSSITLTSFVNNSSTGPQFAFTGPSNSLFLDGYTNYWFDPMAGATAVATPGSRAPIRFSSDNSP